MKPFKAAHIDFAQPQRPPVLSWALLLAALIATALALGELRSSLHTFKRATAPQSAHAEANRASPPAPLSPNEQRIIDTLQTDLHVFEHSIERKLPTGVKLIALSASQESQRITLLLSAPSAKSLLALPAWLSMQPANGHWQLESISAPSQDTATLTATVVCTACWPAR